jgi:hypothetical protein
MKLSRTAASQRILNELSGCSANYYETTSSECECPILRREIAELKEKLRKTALERDEAYGMHIKLVVCYMPIFHLCKIINVLN